MTGLVRRLVLHGDRASRLLRPFPSSYGFDMSPRTPELRDEVAEWCAENLSRAVVPLFGTGSLKWELSFGSEIDHVLFKLRWY